MLVIHRTGLPRLEKAVKISDNSKSWWVNPRTLIGLATGTYPSRLNSIMSFVRGLKDSGQFVVIDERRTGKLERIFAFDRCDCAVILAYYILGLAWGRGEWGNLVYLLQQNVVEYKRLEVLEKTANYYFNQPPFGHEVLRLIIE